MKVVLGNFSGHFVGEGNHPTRLPQGVVKRTCPGCQLLGTFLNLRGLCFSVVRQKHCFH